MQNCLTFQEIKVKIAKIEKALVMLKQLPVQVDNTVKIEKLKMLKESYSKQLDMLTEDVTGSITTEDPTEAEKLAKKGVRVTLVKKGTTTTGKVMEQEATFTLTDEFVDRVLTTVKDVLRDLGEEITKSGVRSNTEDTFDIDIDFTSGLSKTYKFTIEDRQLNLDQVPVTGIDILPSGELNVLDDVLRKGLIDYFEKGLDFQDPDQEEPVATDSKGNLLEIGDKIRVKQSILTIGFDPKKDSVYLKAKNKKKVYGTDKAFGILLEASEKLPVNPDDFEISWDDIDSEFVKQAADWEHDQKDRYAVSNDDDLEAGVTEMAAPTFEIVVSMKHVKLAQQVYKDGAYQSRHGVIQTWADTYASPGETLESDLEGMETFLEDLKRHGVDIRSENITSMTGPEALHESKVEIGDRVKISKEYGGGKGKVVEKRGAFIVLDNGESYHESDVVKISRDVQEDLHIGHQDDEPGMLAQVSYEIANYAADIHKMLKQYESLNHNVNFPNWWQAKVILARDYISKAAHWLEYETRDLDPSQSYLNERRKCKYNN
jgi:hypothetical protein